MIKQERAAGILSAWQEFIADGRSKDTGIRPQILESWVRCYQGGVNPYAVGRQSFLEGEALDRMLRINRDLIDIAKPFMANLYEFVHGSGFVVVLTDRRGYIMELLGDKAIMDNPLTADFFRGASWSETEAGTNAIGTALAVRQPVQVSGPEHYCRKHHCLTCSAAPILDYRGEILGILDVSGARYAAHLHTLGMVVAAVEAICALMAIQQKNRQLSLANKRWTNIFNTMSDGVIVLDQLGNIQEVNPVAQKILGKDKSVLGVPVEKVFGAQSYKKMLCCKEPYADIELMVDTDNGLSHCLASGEPITDEQGVVTGAVVMLRPIKKIQNLVNRFSGYYSSLQFSDIIGNNQAMLEAVRVASLAAASNASVLLYGESGTGKDIFAQAIHNRSDRRNGPFIAVNCGAIPRELIGSELFGYEDGAFTGAKRGGKPGKFELAADGTLFLDEIGDMPLEQQAALLRVLQDKKIVRIGGAKVIPVDVRVICATNKNLYQEVAKGLFRKDLYYRLNVISIIIPPLRKRAEDIILLFKYFLERFDKYRTFSIEPEVMERILRYDWPGNVRELQNVAERIVSLTEGQVITLAQLPPEIAVPERVNQPQFALAAAIAGGRQERQQLLADTERQEILAYLADNGGNVSLTAKALGVSRNTLYRKMRLYAIRN